MCANKILQICHIFENRSVEFKQLNITKFICVSFHCVSHLPNEWEYFLHGRQSIEPNPDAFECFERLSNNVTRPFY